VTLAITVLLAALLSAKPAAKPAATPAAASSADAGRAATERSRFEAYLGDHDVPTAAELRALGKTPDQSLMALSSDAHAAGLVRARATAGLRFFPTPEVQTFLGKLIQKNAKATDATDRLIVRRAALALGWMVVADAPNTLALLFDNDDVEVRVDAAIGLGLTRSEAAVGHLRRRLAVESAPRAREQIERQLRAMGQPTNQPEKLPPVKNEAPMRTGW
jgi:HEAT repeat protein